MGVRVALPSGAFANRIGERAEMLQALDGAFSPAVRCSAGSRRAWSLAEAASSLRQNFPLSSLRRCSCWQMRMEIKVDSDPLKRILLVFLGVLVVLSFWSCHLFWLADLFHPLDHAGFLDNWM